MSAIFVGLAKDCDASKPRTGGANYLRPDLDEKPTEDPQWATFSTDDIKNMLAEAKVKLDGRWGRAKLIEEAEKIIATKKQAA